MEKIFFYIMHTPDHEYFKRGWGNGYVAIDETHPLYNKDYGDDEFSHIQVHGGLTYSEFQEIQGKQYKVFGFDTAHAGDNKTTCDMNYCINETKSLYDQLNKMF